MATINGTEAGDFIHVTGDELNDPEGRNEIALATPTEDTVLGLGGDDLIYSGFGDDWLDGGDGADELHGDKGDDTLLGGAGADTLDGSDGANVLNGGAGADQLVGAGVLDGGIGNDTIVGIGTYSTDSQFGGGGDDVIVGVGPIDAGDGDDTIYGGGAINGGSGVDLCDFTGRDVHHYKFDLELGFYRLGGRGNVDLALTEVENLLTNEGGQAIYCNAAGSWVSAGDNEDKLVGRQGDDTLNGDKGADTLYAGGGIDQLFGGDGDDHLHSGAGGDLLDGGTDFDDLWFEGSSAVVIDVLRGVFTGGSAEGDQIAGIEHIHGTAAGDQIILGGEVRSTYGEGGDDTLGSFSSDTFLAGGRGEDIYWVRADRVDIHEESRGDVDRVQSWVDFGLARRVENLTLKGHARRGTGNNGQNEIVGNKFDNVLQGRNLTDTLYGHDGDDALFGDDYNDVLVGGRGDDSLNGGLANDFLTGGLGKDVLTGGGGRNVFIYSATADSAPGGTGDQLIDFRADNIDLIDLSLIDADANQAGDQAFVFIGRSDFSAAGQIRWAVNDKGAYVLGDTDGDGEADLRINLNGTYGVFDSDFVL